MILGVGIDIVEVERIRSSMEKFGDRFLHRVLLPEEIEYCRQHRYPETHVAARFAAKEALSKAFGTGIGHHLGWRDMQVYNIDSGQPMVRMHGQGQILARQRAALQIHLSLSHTRIYATAVAILEG